MLWGGFVEFPSVLRLGWLPEGLLVSSLCGGLPVLDVICAGSSVLIAIIVFV